MAVYTYFTLMVMLIVMLMVMLMVQHVVLHVRSSDADVLNLVRTGKYVCTVPSHSWCGFVPHSTGTVIKKVTAF